jgi:hypothetical protein
LPSTPAQQYETFRGLLEGKHGLARGKLFDAVVDWLKLPIDLPQDLKTNVKTLVCNAFNVSDVDLREIVFERASQNGHQPDASPQLVEVRQHERIDNTTRGLKDEKDLDLLLPRTGFFRDYCNFTVNSEAPLVYHLYCALAGMVATINRRVWIDMGAFRLYPPLGILILGPSGIKKTSAADIMVNILNEMQLTPVYAEKLTPEALTDAMKGGNATGLVYSPEMTVLLSKQRYMESIIPLLTRFMDSPDIFKSETIMRGKGQITNVAITCLMCSTLDWFIKNTPETIFGGGFIARNIMVLQESGSRIIAMPDPSNARLRTKVITELAAMHAFEGQVTLTPQANQTHVEWYENDKRTRIVEHDILETYYQRKPSHLLRFAMCLHLAQCRTLVVCEDCWHTARRILDWTERFLPGLASRMFKSSWGEDQDLVLKKIAGKGGHIEHSELVRRMQYRMSAAQVRTILSSLKDAGTIKEVRSAIEHTYVLKDPNATDTN